MKSSLPVYKSFTTAKMIAQSLRNKYGCSYFVTFSPESWWTKHLQSTAKYDDSEYAPFRVTDQKPVQSRDEWSEYIYHAEGPIDLAGSCLLRMIKPDMYSSFGIAYGQDEPDDRDRLIVDERAMPWPDRDNCSDGVTYVPYGKG